MVEKCAEDRRYFVVTERVVMSFDLCSNTYQRVLRTGVHWCGGSNRRPATSKAGGGTHERLRPILEGIRCICVEIVHSSCSKSSGV